jgi:RNA polymerase sigma factor (TIGR02999 family)
MSDITTLLQRARAGDDRAAIDQVIAALYPDLHRMARAYLARNGTITLLDATSLVHEAYERLRRVSQLDASCRGQFLSYASQVMRSVMVDFVRKRRAGRRGGGNANANVPLSTGLRDESEAAVDAEIELVHDALLELEATDPRLKQLVEMRYFGGLSDQDIAQAMGVNERSVRRDWQRARLLLRVAIKR